MTYSSYSSKDSNQPAPPESAPPARETRSRRSEQWIIWGWVLIAAKCAAVWWACHAYPVPIHPLWLIIPTVVFGLLATALYIWRD